MGFLSFDCSLVISFICSFIGWLVGWLVHSLPGWLVGWFVPSFVIWLVVWLVGCKPYSRMFHSYDGGQRYDERKSGSALRNSQTVRRFALRPLCP